MIKKLKEILIKEEYRLYLGYYPMVALGYCLALFSRQVRPGIIATALLLIIWLQSVISLFLCREPALAEGDEKCSALSALFYMVRFSTLDIVAVIFFVYNLMSGIWCTAWGMPVSVWAGDFCTGILTMIFFYAGRTIRDEARAGFYRCFVWAVYLLGIVGIILFIWGPGFYLDYLYDITLISKADVPTMRVRMHSVTGSIQLGYLGVAAMAAGIHLFVSGKGDSVKKARIRGGMAILFGMLTAFLSNQRFAMVAALLILVYINFLVFFTFKILPMKYFYIEAGVLVAGFLTLCLVFMGAVMKVYYRLVSLPGAIGQRSDQWIGAMNNMHSLWLGNGLGANGHRAAGITEHLIADGGVAKIFVETGVIGTAVFAFMMILCFRYGIRYLSDCCAETGILAMTLLGSIGSNILEFQVVTPIFWFAAGVISARCSRYSKKAPGVEES